MASKTLVIALVVLVAAAVTVTYVLRNNAWRPGANLVAVNVTRTPFRHVVVIILENWSFDSIFGTYPFGYYKPVINNVTLSLMRPEPIDLGTRVPVSPNASQGFMGITYINSTTPRGDPGHSDRALHVDWNWGEDNGWVAGSGAYSLHFIDYNQVPLLWDYAELYVLAEDYFSPQLDPTEPNRLAYLTGYPVPIHDDGNHYDQLDFSDTILYQLSRSNVTWGYYAWLNSRIRRCRLTAACPT
jgi:phospholipase C